MKKLILFFKNWFRDYKAEEHYKINLETRQQIELIHKQLNKIETVKIDRILETLHISVDGLEDSDDIYNEAQRLYPGANESAERQAFIRGVKFQSKRAK